MRDALIFGAVGFVAYLGIVVVLLRIWSAHAAAVAVLTALVVYPVSLIGFAAAGDAVMFWPASATYWCLSLLFLMGFGAIYKSISLRILGDLLSQPGYAENYDVVLQRYVVSESFEHRLGVIQSSGFALLRDGNFTLTSKGQTVAFLARWVQQMFKIERSG